ncbi:hypothetical protein Poli38472_011776 [Pythium oligandrum]|uniref:Uncharacterized protein n=1 Tax=Pythium oligandrum TaxID=41045 RepID=A0A8K1C861_PYTOL|nr:hypothetical protein Poli38472_011776 [Pythium oligandrum]|eukprot:TMW58188.1 hypothetical protein Poli38472_011776 [Pythium oligandrum]
MPPKGRGGGGGGREGGGRGRGGRDGGGRGGRGGEGGGRGRGRGAGGGRGGPLAPPQRPVSSAKSTQVTPPLPPAAPVVVRPLTTEVAQLAEDLEEKASVSEAVVSRTTGSSDLPRRPGFGTVGRPVELYANHFRVKWNEDMGDVYHYDVTITEAGGRKIGTGDLPPKSLAEKIMRALVTAMREQYPGVAVVSDFRKNVFTPTRLPHGAVLFENLDIGERRGADQTPRLYQAVVKAASPVEVRMHQVTELLNGRLNYTPQDAIQALDIVLRYSAALRYTMVGRNLYSAAGAVPIGEGAMAWRGYFQSLRPTQNRLVLNLDLSTTAFVREMEVLDFVAEVVATRQSNAVPQSLRPHQYAAVNKAIRGVKVETTHRPGVRRTYRVNGLSPKSAAETFFEDDNGRRQSVAQYFAQHYRALRYPQLPCLHVGAVNKKTYFPMEICKTVAGQKCPRKITDTQTAEMIKVAATKPQDRKAQIESKVREAHFDRDATLRSFGLEVDPNMVTTQARVLPPPKLAYGRNATVNPDANGTWNMRGKSFVQGQQLKSFAVISMDDRLEEHLVDEFFKMVLNQARELGMGNLTRSPPVVWPSGRNPSVRALFGQALDEARRVYGSPAQIVWLINPRQDARTYGELKRVSDTELGIVSQCMLSKFVMRPNPQYVSNILLKVNTKLGGRNATLQGSMPQIVDRTPTIIFGADVTHPSPGDKSRPSIAALVGSLDRAFTKHASVISAQGHRVEQIVNLRDMVVDLLREFYRASGGTVQPQQIIFYRDGVSEGQFDMVRNFEVTAIREACALLSPTYQPAITFIVVQKRHHTRLFVSNPRDADKSGNVKPGTVVDRGICHPTEFDFYLMSHSGLQGTSRPSHYHVLFDEIGFSADDLQTLTYRLCYTYARCTRSVSMVPSAYYSHLLAYRARFFTPDGMDSTSIGGASTETTNLEMAAVHPSLKPIQYYV